MHAGGANGRRGVFPKVDLQRLSFSLKQGSGIVFGDCRVSDEPGLRCSLSDNRQRIDIAHTGGEVPETIRVSLAFALPTRQVALTFQLEGPARLSIQQVSQDKQQASKEKLTDLNGPRDTGSVLARIVQWSPGNKLRVRPVDHEFQEVSEISVDGTKVWPLQPGKRASQDDKGIEISLKPDAKAAGIVIKTADRLFSVPMTVVTSPRTAVDIKLQTRLKQDKVTTLSIDKQPGQVPLAEVKPDHALTVELQEKDKERLEIDKMLLRGGKTPRAIIGPMLKFQREDFLGAKLALTLDITVREAAFNLPDKFRLQPVVQIGKRELLLKSCKVELEDFLEGSKFTSKGGYTEVTLAQDKRAPKTRTYGVKVHRDAKVCTGLEVRRPIKVAQLKELRLDATLTIPLRRPSSRAFVGIVSLSKDIRSKEHNWRAALEALADVFDAGAKEGKYLWGAIYGPQGQLLVTSGDTADYAPFDLDEVSSGSQMDSLTGGAGLPFGSLVTRVAKLKNIADFEGNVDTLVVADEPFQKCGWSDPPFAQGSRAAFVRLTGSVSGGKEIVSGVRVCEGTDKGDKKSSDKSGVVAEIEVVPKEWSRGAENDVQLRRAIAEAAKGFSKAQSSQ